MKKRLLCILFAAACLCLSACGQGLDVPSAKPDAGMATSSAVLPSIAVPLESEPDPSLPQTAALEFPEGYEHPVLVAAGGQVLSLVPVDRSEAEKGSSFPLPSDAPYVPVGDPLQLQFRGELPNQITLLDDVIDEEGHLKFNGNVTNTIPLTLKNGKASIPFPGHFIAAASSDPKDYKPGGVFCGFRLICQYDSGVEYYMFVLRTDAKFSW